MPAPLIEESLSIQRYQDHRLLPRSHNNAAQRLSTRTERAVKLNIGGKNGEHRLLNAGKTDYWVYASKIKWFGKNKILFYEKIIENKECARWKNDWNLSRKFRIKKLGI